jgi:2-iminobutanoate/2-iminopropanoate deaminase
MKRPLFAFSAIVTFSLGVAATLLAQEKSAAPLEYFPVPANGATSAPYSAAVRLGDTLYVSGQLGTVPGKGLVPGGIETETRQTLENLKTVLERNGSSMTQVAKCTVFLADIKDFAAFNAVYREYFKTNLPARTTVAASLVIGARIEIECIAHVAPTK